MRLRFIVSAFLLVLCGCEPQPEIFAMKSKDLGGNSRATSYYTNGVLSSESISTKNNGIDDVWHFYLDGKLVRIDEDTNFDGVVDKSRSYDVESGGLILLKVDTDYDGTFDKQETFDPNKSFVADRKTPVDKNKEAAAKREAADSEIVLEQTDDFVFTEEETVIQTPDETIIEEDFTVTEQPVMQEESRIVIEEDDFPRSKGSGSYFQPLEVDSTGGVSPARGAKIIPAPVFRHPSDNLEE